MSKRGKQTSGEVTVRLVRSGDKVQLEVIEHGRQIYASPRHMAKEGSFTFGMALALMVDNVDSWLRFRRPGVTVIRRYPQKG